MWPRRQLDIGWKDLAFGFAQLFWLGRRPSEGDVVGVDWVRAEEAFVALSVRSAWDLYLDALALPVGSEVVVSGVTIPDMVRIIERHGLVAVPVDIDPARLDVDADGVERAITERTRAILVAHLFGSRMDMTPIVEVARQHGLYVVEDCAQAFVGREYAGHPASDCVLFSFGPIKTATALGGAVARVSDARVRTRMAELDGMRRVQNRVTFAKRLMKYSALLAVENPRMYGGLIYGLKWLGIDYDRVMGCAAHSFGSGDIAFFAQIRRRPSAPLVRLLGRRLRRFERCDAGKLQRRRERGEALAQRLPNGMVVGAANPTHSYWVLPLRIANGDVVVAALRAAGFDATCRSSLVVVADKRELSVARRDEEIAPWLKETVFLPSAEDLPEREWQRMIEVVRQMAVPAERAVDREHSAAETVSAAL